MVYLRAAMLLLVLLCCLSPAAAQPVPPSPRQVTVFDGLPSNTVNRMAEDRYGYLWIATNDGLARYDGRNYRIWRSEDGLRDNRIWTVSGAAQRAGDREAGGGEGADSRSINYDSNRCSRYVGSQSKYARISSIISSGHLYETSNRRSILS